MYAARLRFNCAAQTLTVRQRHYCYLGGLSLGVAGAATTWQLAISYKLVDRFYSHVDNSTLKIPDIIVSGTNKAGEFFNTIYDYSMVVPPTVGKYVVCTLWGGYRNYVVQALQVSLKFIKDNSIDVNMAICLQITHRYGTYAFTRLYEVIADGLNVICG